MASTSHNPDAAKDSSVPLESDPLLLEFLHRYKYDVVKASFFVTANISCGKGKC
jgi:hypothetical protein